MRCPNALDATDSMATERYNARDAEARWQKFWDQREIFATRNDVQPYLELGGGTLFTSSEVPQGTSKVNFTSGAAFGMHFFGKKAWSVEVRYMHISNAGLTSPNPGINTVQVRLGIGKFFERK